MSVLIKYLVVFVAIIAVLFGVYESGKSSGYTQGYQIAWNAQQKTIDAQATAANKLAQENNTKLSQLELAAMAAQSQAEQLKAQAKSRRASTVTLYKAANPNIVNTCGWSPPTAEAINQILNADQPVPASAPVPASSASAVGASQ